MAEVQHSPAARSPWEKPHPVGAFPEGNDHYFREVDPKHNPHEGDVTESMANGANGAEASPSVKSDYRTAIPEESMGGDHYTTNVPEEELSPEDAVDSNESKAASAADNLDDKAAKGDQKTDAGPPPSKVGAKNDEDVKAEQKQGEDEESGRSGTKADDKAKPDEVGRQSDLQEVEPEPIGEDVEQAQEKPTDTTTKVGEEQKKPGDGEASTTGSTVKEGMSKIGSAVGSAVGAGGGDASKRGEEKEEDASVKLGDEKLNETEAQVGSTTEEGKDKLEGAAKESKDKFDENAEDDKSKLGEAAEAKTGEAGDDAEAAKPDDSTEKADQVDYSILKGGKVNKGGNVVDSDGKVVGRVVEGVLGHLVGKRVDENGAIWNDSGSIIGRAEPIPADELESIIKKAGPFEAFPDAVVDGEGMVVFEGEQIGKVVEGDVKKLRGMKVDPDGDILDRAGNVVGRAERWEPEPQPEPEPEPEVDRSILAGKRVNKAGNVVDGSGTIFGRVVEGDVKRMVGRMCDKKGNILSESGDVLGRAEVVTEGEREGSKEGPFAELSGLTVTREG